MGGRRYALMERWEQKEKMVEEVVVQNLGDESSWQNLERELKKVKVCLIGNYFRYHY